MAWYIYAFAHDGAWHAHAQGLINVQLQPTHQTPQAVIALHFIAIVLSESRRKNNIN